MGRQVVLEFLEAQQAFRRSVFCTYLVLVEVMDKSIVEYY